MGVSGVTGRLHAIWRGRKSPRGSTAKRAGLAGLAIGSFVLIVLLVAPLALAAPSFTTIQGVDRYQTAIKISQAKFVPDGPDAVVLASGTSFPDALVAGPLAAAYHGPVLLTHSSYLDTAVRTEINRLKPDMILLVGLPTAVVNQVNTAFPAIRAAGNVIQLTGPSRYQTSRLVANKIKEKLGPRSRVVIAPGETYAYSLSIGPLASAQGWPIVLTPALPALGVTATQAIADLGATEAVIVGTNVSTTALPTLTVVKRIFPASVYQASADIAVFAKEQGSSFQHIAFTNYTDYPDALAAAPYLAADNGILLLTSATSVPSSISAVVSAHATEIEKADFIALGSGVVWQVWSLLPVTDAPPSTPNLVIGSRGAAVAWLEQKLTSLTYRPGLVDGVFDQKTYQAVIAFQKWEGLTRDGKVNTDEWAKLVSAVKPTAARAGTLTGTWVEVDKPRQVLLVVQEGVVIKTLPVSTGSASVGIITPSGDFTILMRKPGFPWPGHVYDPCFFLNHPKVGWAAVHGYPTVPVYPASHGCVRVCMWDMTDLYPQLPVGTKLIIY
jgi:lipoprotein-anchoring transpeptidase ErfK/SrfK